MEERIPSSEQRDEKERRGAITTDRWT